MCGGAGQANKKKRVEKGGKKIRGHKNSGGKERSKGISRRDSRVDTFNLGKSRVPTTENLKSEL